MRQRRHPLKSILDGLLLGLGGLDCTCTILCFLALVVLVAVVVLQVTAKVSCVPDIAQLLLANLTVDVLSLFLVLLQTMAFLSWESKKNARWYSLNLVMTAEVHNCLLRKLTPFSDCHIPRKWRRVFTSCRHFLIYSFTAAS